MNNLQYKSLIFLLEDKKVNYCRSNKYQLHQKLENYNEQNFELHLLLSRHTTSILLQNTRHKSMKASLIYIIRTLTVYIFSIIYSILSRFPHRDYSAKRSLVFFFFFSLSLNITNFQEICLLIISSLSRTTAGVWPTFSQSNPSISREQFTAALIRANTAASVDG